MIRPVYSEMRTIYETTVSNPHTFRITMKMKDMIDQELLEQAARKTVKRYPYFAMKLKIRKKDIVFEDNDDILKALQHFELID